MYPQGSRRASAGRGGGASARASSGSYARQSAAPYSRPSAPAPASQSWPPSQLSIRGASSIPTQVLVANLARGTSSEDVRQTFLQFGEIIRVKERRVQGSNQSSVAYEVLFEEKPAAVKAVEQLHGALADGRVLTVSIETDSPPTTSPAPAAAAASTPAAGGPTPPTGPRSNGRAANGNGKAANQPSRELIETPAVAAKKAAAAAAHAAIPRGPAGQALTNKDRRALVNAAAKQAVANVTAASTIPRGPKAQSKQAAPAKVASLQSRLGGLPLAQRLGDVKGSGKAGAGSDITTLDAQKSKKNAKREKAKLAAAAAAQGGAASVPGVPGQGTSAAAKRKRKVKAKQAAAGAGGMEVD